MTFEKWASSDFSRTRRWLMQAGYRDAMDVNYYFGARILMATIGFVSITVLTAFRNPPLLIGVTGLGFILPRFILKRMIRDRQARIRLGLPDALDLTVICVEAGLALDQALMRVGQDLHHAHPDLSEEFHLVNLEMRAGKPRAEALRHLVERTGVDDLRALVGTLIQTDRFGTSIAQALRVHSDSLRTERRQRVEEQAAKTTIKMVPPRVIWQKKFGLSFWESLRRTITVDLLRPCASLLRGRTVEMAPFQKVPRILAITMLVLFLVVLAIVRWHP